MLFIFILMRFLHFGRNDILYLSSNDKRFYVTSSAVERSNPIIKLVEISPFRCASVEMTDYIRAAVTFGACSFT